MTTTPDFIYGTAWKEEETARLVLLALQAGFRSIDTANQRKHYFEAGVGRALAAALAEGLVRREELFLQTKFTFRPGQDQRLPYDPAAPVGTQVIQSFESSLEHLGLGKAGVLDSLVLHGPSRHAGLHSDDLEAWRAMESLVAAGRVRALGISNVAVDQLQLLCEKSEVAPRFVQNRCFAHDAWDAEMRSLCRERNIAYQGFSLLTANVHVLRGPEMAALARQHERTPAQLVFAFARQVGMIPLTGTTDPEHMRQDLASRDISLTTRELQLIEHLGEQ